MVRKITGKHLLCLCLLVFPLSWAEDTRRNVKKSESDKAWSQAKNRRMFARRQNAAQENTRHRIAAATPARRCSRLMENCSSRLPCCDPCASCRCRLFNTICHCWRMNQMCPKRRT